MISPQLNSIFDRLWQDFTLVNPQAREIHQLLESRGDKVVNDHIAFRTFGDPRISIDVIARPFVAEGYVRKDEYHFAEKKLAARHFEHPDPQAPKVFISELILTEFDTGLQHKVRELVDMIPEHVIADPMLCASGRPWSVSFEEYEALLARSEYAAWMAAFGFRANHFTVLVNELTSVNGLADLNGVLKQAGFKLNSQGGEIKGSPQDYLEQSSTLASQIDVEFSDGPRRIPGCYYEFARRYPLADGMLFQGFVAKSADKIFESTHHNAM